RASHRQGHRPGALEGRGDLGLRPRTGGQESGSPAPSEVIVVVGSRHDRIARSLVEALPTAALCGGEDLTRPGGLGPVASPPPGRAGPRTPRPPGGGGRLPRPSRPAGWWTAGWWTTTR